VLAGKFSGRLKSRPSVRIGRKSKPEGSGFTNYLKGKEKMKSYRNALAAIALAFAFATSTFAGEGIMHTEKTPPPPPPQAESVMWTDIALNLMQTLLPLL
jgi:hypothetical protein